MSHPLKIGLVSISDRASSGVYEDKGIPALQEWFGRALASSWTMETRLIPDDQASIESNHGQTATISSVIPILVITRSNIEIQTDRRMTHADLHIHHHQNAEVHQIDTELDRYREEDEGKDQNNRRWLHEITSQQQDDVDREQEGSHPEAITQHPFG